jgi:hypothetical protein
MSTITTDYQLAAGHNNVAGYTVISEITDGTTTLDEPLVRPTISRGVRRFTLAQPKFSGTAFAALVFTRMSGEMLEYMKDNYEGLVTVRLPLDGSTFANYNATLIIPDPADLEGSYYVDAQTSVEGYQDVRCELFDIEAV